MKKKWREYFYLMRAHKPIGILLLLWPTLWALWLASHGKPDPLIVAVFVAGVILMRSAGCVMNDIVDRHIDKEVKRTRDRPLAAGRIHKREAIVLCCLLLLGAFCLVLLLNPFTVFLAGFGVVLAFVYPFMKRYTHLPQAALGVAFSWGVPMAFAAVTNSIPPAAWLLFFTAAVWPVIYDTMYAMVDKEDDLRIGVKSTAILFGQLDTVMIATFQVSFLILLAWVGLCFDLNAYFYLSLLVAEGFFAWEQYLLKDHRPEKSYRAFVNNHWVGLVVFVGIVLGSSQ
jgi:4-hydroxybenzoate polyprenyltransferase